MTRHRCATCAYFSAAPFSSRGQVPHGQCRRHAPVLVQSAEGRLQTQWPLVDERTWCGEHSAAEAA
jgi:hypothetical protein